MGDIAEGLLNGDFDEITGEYLGEGMGFPRSLHYKKNSNKYSFSKHQDPNKRAVHGVEAYLCNNKIITRIEKRTVVSKFVTDFLVYNYKLNGYEKSCVEIQKVFKEFKGWLTDYKKGAFN